MYRPPVYHPQQNYFNATRHPYPCLVFLLPLLAAYELGVLWLGGTQPESLRNGADTWLHWGLEAFGLYQLYWVPGLIAGIFVLWSWQRRWDRPRDLTGVCTGMAVESMLFAAGLWGLSRNLVPMLESFGITMDVTLRPDPTTVQVITYVGAGIYEEVLFRLLLYSALAWLLTQMNFSSFLVSILAASGSALIFSAAHHVGPYGENFDNYVFLFRTLAGLYFTLLYQLRGFGVAVGAHACYDVLVGILVK